MVHGYLPALAAGSERMLQHMLAPLVPRGHDVEVWAIHSPDTLDTTVDGVRVRGGMRDARSVTPDVIVAHHGPGVRYAAYVGRVHQRAALVHVVHNDRFDVDDVMSEYVDLRVFNTQWIADKLNDHKRPSLVVRPPLMPDMHYVTAIGDAVTLVNLSGNKGVGLFGELIRTMPDTEFLGVMGTHGTQEVHSGRNVSYMDTQQDMRAVWRRTRVLLVPSAYESFGMVAAEACVSGIPVVAHPTPGLRECLGAAGIYAERSNVDAYQAAIKWLTNDRDAYTAASLGAFARAAFLRDQTTRDLDAWTEAIEGLAP